MAFAILLAKFIKYSRSKHVRRYHATAFQNLLEMAVFIWTHNIIQMAIHLRKTLILIKIVEEIWLLTNVCWVKLAWENKQKVHKIY